jgi:hypothetical protein
LVVVGLALIALPWLIWYDGRDARACSAAGGTFSKVHLPGGTQMTCTIDGVEFEGGERDWITAQESVKGREWDPDVQAALKAETARLALIAATIPPGCNAYTRYYLYDNAGHLVRCID